MSNVLIIGGGIIGLSLARQLHKKGFKKITILERGAIGRESSYAAAGMLAVQAETDQPDSFSSFVINRTNFIRILPKNYWTKPALILN